MAQARGALSRGGKVAVVDFADFGGMPEPVARGFRKYLRTFHVEPLGEDDWREAESVERGPARYFVRALFAPRAAA